MKFYSCVVFCEVFMFLEATKPRSVNLALQTVLEFNNNNNSADIQMIDKARHFLKELKKDITNKDRHDNRHNDEVEHRVYTSEKRHKHKSKLERIDEPYKFTDFIKDVSEILTTYNDDNLVEAIKVMAEEINKRSVNINKLYKLYNTQQLRRTMSQNIKSINQASPQDIRNKLNTIVYMIDMDLFTDEQKNVISVLNSLHGQESDSGFRNLINNLRQYGIKSRRANDNLIEIIRNGVNYIFDQFSKRISKIDNKTLQEFNIYNNEAFKNCTIFFCPAVFSFLNKVASLFFGNVNKTRDNITNDIKIQNNYNDKKVNNIIERIKKQEISEKVADLFDTVQNKKHKNKRMRHGSRQTKLTEVENNGDNINEYKQKIEDKEISGKLSIFLGTGTEKNGKSKEKKADQKSSLLSEKLKQNIKNSAPRFIKLYEEAITKRKQHSARYKTTRMGDDKNKKRRKVLNKIILRDSRPRNIIYEHDAAINVQGPVDVPSEKHHKKIKNNFHGQSFTSKVHTERPLIKQLRKALNVPPAASHEGLTIESFENSQPIRRKYTIYNKNTDDYKTAVLAQATSGDILSRLTNLEKELDVVKKQISEVNVRKKDVKSGGSSVESEYKNDKIPFESTTPKVPMIPGMDKRTPKVSADLRNEDVVSNFTSGESESTESDIEGKNDKATKTLVIESTTPKVTKTLGINNRPPKVSADVRNEDAVSDDTSREGESTESDFEDKNKKSTKSLVIESTTSKIITALGIDKRQHKFRALDDELNNSIEDELNTESYQKKTEVKENKADIKNSVDLKKIMTEKRNNEEDKEILAAALKKMENKPEAKLKLDKTAEYKGMTRLEELSGTTNKTLTTEYKLGDSNKVNKEHIPNTFPMIDSNQDQDLSTKTYMTDFEKFFNETDKIDFEER